MPQKTPEEWVKIRADFESGDFTTKELVAKWDVKQPTIDSHAAKGQWMNGRTGKRRGMTAIQKAETEPVPKGEVSASMNKEKLDAALEDITAKLLAPEEESDLERVQRELEEAKAELAQYKPVQVEWPVDFDTAAGMLASELGDRVQMELNAINDDRTKRGLPFFTVADMDEQRPGWSKSIRDQIIQDTVDDLTRWASNEGPSLHKVDMLRPDGVTKEQVPYGPNIDNGQRPAMLRARGWRDIDNQSCHRWNCYGPLPDGDPYDGFHSRLHKALFDWQYPETDKGVTTTGVFEAGRS